MQNVKCGVFQLSVCLFRNRVHKAVDIHVKCNRQPVDKGPLARGGGAVTHIQHCVRSLYSPSGAASLATLVVPHSAMSVGAAWNRMTTSVWWLCGNPGVELRCRM